ncbi:MAG: hypothetical protein JXX29_03315, partial [Deltaproteobacteria bacterium]|nr:hypothetical protein [Deltaproteobacteria bacterium]
MKNCNSFNLILVVLAIGFFSCNSSKETKSLQNLGVYNAGHFETQYIMSDGEVLSYELSEQKLNSCISYYCQRLETGLRFFDNQDLNMSEVVAFLEYRKAVCEADIYSTLISESGDEISIADVNGVAYDGNYYLFMSECSDNKFGTSGYNVSEIVDIKISSWEKSPRNRIIARSRSIEYYWTAQNNALESTYNIDYLLSREDFMDRHPDVAGTADATGPALI